MALGAALAAAGGGPAPAFEVGVAPLVGATTAGGFTYSDYADAFHRAYVGDWFPYYWGGRARARIAEYHGDVAAFSLNTFHGVRRIPGLHIDLKARETLLVVGAGRSFGDGRIRPTVNVSARWSRAHGVYESPPYYTYDINSYFGGAGWGMEFSHTLLSGAVGATAGYHYVSYYYDGRTAWDNRCIAGVLDGGVRFHVAAWFAVRGEASIFADVINLGNSVPSWSEARFCVGPEFILTM
jgi:hypothetical protein